MILNTTDSAALVPPSTPSRYAVAAVLIQGRQTDFQVGLLRTSEGKSLLFEAIPKLRNQRQALGRRQTPSLIGREQLHSLENTQQVRVSLRVVQTVNSRELNNGPAGL